MVYLMKLVTVRAEQQLSMRQVTTSQTAKISQVFQSPAAATGTSRSY